MHHRTVPAQCGQPRIECVKASLDSVDETRAAIDGADRIVFMVPGQPKVLHMAQNFIAAVRAQVPDVKQIIFVSECDAPSAMLQATAFYRESQAAVDLVMASGLPITRLEPAIFMQVELL